MFDTQWEILKRKLDGIFSDNSDIPQPSCSMCMWYVFKTWLRKPTGYLVILILRQETDQQILTHIPIITAHCSCVPHLQFDAVK